MRRVDCRRCGVVAVEEVPWGDGKRTLTKAYMLCLARWARRLSWKETAETFRTSWDKVFDAVEHIVTWGLEQRTLGQINAMFSTWDCNGGKAKVTMRKSYGFRSYRVLELALYHSLGKLPEPESTHDFF